MHRIDHATAVADMFTEGNPSGGIPPTVVTADIMNAIQEEIAGYIESRSIALNKPDNTQLQQAIEGHVRGSAGGGFRNLIINPDFRIQQRQTFPSAAVSLLTTDIDTCTVDNLDRWYLTAGGSGVGTAGPSSFTVGQTDVPFEPETYMSFVISTGASTSDPAIIQPIEEVRTAAGQTLTVSFWARVASGTLTATVDFRQFFGAGGSSDVIVTSQNDTVDTTWTKYSFTFAIPSISGMTIGDETNYLALRIRLPQSTTFTLDITHVQVEFDTGASLFEVRTRAQELELCQRYFETSKPPDFSITASAGDEHHFMTNYDGGGENSFAGISGIAFQVRKRIEDEEIAGPYFSFYRGGVEHDLFARSGSTSALEGIDEVIISRHAPISGLWTSAQPASAGLYIGNADWICDCEFSS